MKSYAHCTNKNTKYVVWGAGHRGRILSDLLGPEKIVAYIDSNEAKIGTDYLGRPIISYDTYREQYGQYIVIVALTFGSAICKKLEKDQICFLDIEDCPPEFMGYGLTTAKKYFENYSLALKRDEKIALYGASLYTFEVYERLCARGYDSVNIILPQSMEPSQKRKFQEHFPAVQMEDEVTADRIIVTDKRFYLEERENSVPVFDFIEWSDFIPGYHNEKIARLNNLYEGKRCFIVATGPSIRYEDLNTLHQNQEYCISINAIFKCFGQTPWRPDAYVILDADGIKELNEEHDFDRLSDIKYKFIADTQPYVDYRTLDSDWLVYHSILDNYSIKQMLISGNAAQKVYNGSSVVYVCMQIAMYLGFKEIYLLGVDFSYLKGQKNHFINQFEPDDIFDGMSLQNKIQEISYLAFCKARQYADAHGIKIYNATRGGYLEVFERADFDTLF